MEFAKSLGILVHTRVGTWILYRSKCAVRYIQNLNGPNYVKLVKMHLHIGNNSRVVSLLKKIVRNEEKIVSIKV